MAKKTSATVKDKKLLKSYVTQINAEMKILAGEIKKLSENLDKMMKGEKDGPFWNGEDAQTFFKVAVANLKHDIDDYVTAKEKLDALGELYELVNLGYKK